MYVLYVFVRIHIYDRIVRICHYMYVFVSICMYISICTYCMYMYVYVCISNRHTFIYIPIQTNTDNTYIYVNTFRICTRCKCTYLAIYTSEYFTNFSDTYEYVQHGSLMAALAAAPGSIRSHKISYIYIVCIYRQFRAICTYNIVLYLRHRIIPM